MQKILGIMRMGGMETYLGIPESIGGPKTQVFNFITERLNNRVNGWAMKFLSRGGNEVLIKSVLTALPTYVMSYFRLPKAITKKLSSIIAQFWWSAEWKHALDVLGQIVCSEGGMGIGLSEH